MEKKNRKNRKPLIVVAMLLMVALVVGMGAMTYSRYVSSFNSGTQQATAAKWGFVVTANADSLFGEDYSGTGLAVVNNGGSNLVVSAKTDDAKVVAPGTTGFMTISINGVAEVLAELTVTASNIKEISYDGYSPVKWSLYNDTTPIIENTTLSAALAEIANTKIPAGIEAEYEYKLVWSWALDTGDTEAAKLENSIKDTIIGIKSAGKTYAEVQNSVMADGKKFSEYVSEANYNTTGDAAVIKTVLAFELSIKLEQVQA